MKTARLALTTALVTALMFGGASIPASATAVPDETALPDSLQPLPGATEPATDAGILPDALPDAGMEGPAPLPSPAESHPAESAPDDPAGPQDTAADTAADPGADEDDGYEYVPVGEGHVVPGPDTPLITEADGSVRSAVETGHEHSEPETSGRALGQGGAATMLAARAGDIKVTLVRATVNGNGGLVNLQAARNSVATASSYWRAASNGRLSMTIASEKVHYSSSANTSDDYATMMNKIARELKWVDNPYTALVVFVPTADLSSGGYGGILGGGWTVGGTAGRILMPAPSNFTNNVVTHEFGHLLGLLHANSLQCTNGRSDVAPGNGRWADGACSSREYGDTSDLMGFAQYSIPTINSLFWDKGSFGRGNEILNAGDANRTRSFTLSAWSGTAQNRAVKFRDPKSGEVYYLELRLPVGRDAGTATGGNRGVKIVKTDSANSWALNSLLIAPSTRPVYSYTHPNSAWQAGQTFTTHTGVKVRIDWISGSEAGITITGVQSPDRTLRTVSPGDFNGDGAADLISRRSDGTLWLSAGNGKGSFGAPRRIGTGWEIFDLILGPGDYDGDGRNDLLARHVDGSLWLYSGTGAVNNSNEGYRPGRKIGDWGWDEFQRIVAVSNVNGGGPDLLAVRPNGQALLYSGTGKGGHGPSSSAGSGWNQYNLLVGTGDFNGDGRPDVIGRTPDGTIVLRPGYGNGSFGAGTVIGTGWNIFGEILGGSDFDRNGRPDLVGRSSNGSLLFYSGTQKITQGYAPAVSTSSPGIAESVKTLSVSDFDGDARPDLLSVRRDGTLWLHPGKGKGTYGSPRKIGSGWNIYSEVTSPGDFNGDGRADLVAVKPDGTLWFYAGTGVVNGNNEGYRPAVQIGSGWQIFSQVLGTPDLSGDGRPDLLARHRDGSLWLYRGTGRVGGGAEGYLAGLRIGDYGWENLTLTAAGTYDRDARNDVLARTPTGSLLLYRGQGNGRLAAGEQVGTGWNIFRDLLGTGDTTGDGIPDLLGIKPSGATSHYAGDGMKNEGYQPGRTAGSLN
ncbi:MAG: FG-GAP-like repeat-containing protein [Arthrobacter sp.]